MKMYIPEIGDYIHLGKDWSFNLFNEHRNLKLIRYFKREACALLVKNARDDYNHSRISVEEYNEIWKKNAWPDLSTEVTLPAESILKIDRIYIRKGNTKYSSVSFYLVDYSGKKPKSYRFWAKLADVNNIEFNKIEI